MTNSKSNQTSGQNKGNQKSDNNFDNLAKGFAAMPHAQVQEIARKGGEARAEQLGHEGYVELGHEGGSAPHSSRGRSGSSDQDNKDSNQQTKSQRSNTEENKGDERQKTSASSSSSFKGFASQLKDKVREAASKGGQHSGKSR